MKTAGALILSAFVAVATTSTFGQQRVLAAAVTNHQLGASNTLVLPGSGDWQSRPLFHIGGLPVYAWAPVEAPYNGAANRNLAADPLWGSS